MKKVKSVIDIDTLVNAIDAAQGAHDHVMQMVPAVKAAGIDDAQLRDALKIRWNFEELSKQRKQSAEAMNAYKSVTNKISYWIKTIFGSKGLTEETKKKMKAGRLDGIKQILLKHNIDPKKAAKIAAEIVG